ncbi:MAG TPA: RdgB/HAM1 family non-canonical purine NTP pyrophosphatase [Oscillospiraceae bacterium]|jgi:XTP/dITP diphosphohydrolase|nr:RdgB/HAM1 family non-canonical purine NTP pyrophosphatase [Oscillospiraceae bacterium]
MLKLVLASANKSKILEFRRIAEPYPVEIIMAGDIGFDQEIEETGSSFAENALQKARIVHEFSRESYVIADDSGLCVDALDGAPGIYSARFGSSMERLTARERNALLLELMKEVPDNERTAHFHCSIVLISAQAEEKIFDGQVHGKIMLVPSGKHGFGYDPIFLADNYTVSLAELSDIEKDKISHRGIALRACLDYLTRA